MFDLIAFVQTRLVTDLLQNIKEGIEGRPVSWYREVFDLVFPGLDHAEASNVWKSKLAKPDKEAEGDEGEKDGVR